MHQSVGSLSGQVINNKYRIDASLGRGGMAEVYRALELQTGQVVVLKFLQPELAQDEYFIQSLRYEAQILKRLDYEHIIRIYDFDQEGTLAFLVLEYVPGQTLAQRLINPLPLGEGLEILKQIGLALHVAHREGVLHADLKPENILLTAGGKAMLTDFGLARLLGVTNRPGVQAGTPAYMSPEQFLGHALSPRTDVYSLGVVAYQILTGHLPFMERPEDGADRWNTMRLAHLQAEPNLPSQVNPSLPAAVDEVLTKALRKQPNDRYQTVMQFIVDLEDHLKDLAGDVPRIDALATLSTPFVSGIKVDHRDTAPPPIVSPHPGVQTVPSAEISAGALVFSEDFLGPQKDARDRRSLLVHLAIVTCMLVLVFGVWVYQRSHSSVAAWANSVRSWTNTPVFVPPTPSIPPSTLTVLQINQTVAPTGSHTPISSVTTTPSASRTTTLTLTASLTGTSSPTLTRTTTSTSTITPTLQVTATRPPLPTSTKIPTKKPKPNQEATNTPIP